MSRFHRRTTASLCRDNNVGRGQAGISWHLCGLKGAENWAFCGMQAGWEFLARVAFETAFQSDLTG